MTYRMIHFTKVSCFVGDKMKILFISLGCDKNLVDSEHMIGVLLKMQKKKALKQYLIWQE